MIYYMNFILIPYSTALFSCLFPTGLTWRLSSKNGHASAALIFQFIQGDWIEIFYVFKIAIKRLADSLLVINMVNIVVISGDTIEIISKHYAYSFDRIIY